MATPTPTIERATDQLEAMVALENQAKLLYDIWASYHDGNIAWERLPDETQSGWRHIVRFTSEEASCEKCGEPLFCITCDAGVIREAIPPYDDDDDDDDDDKPIPAIAGIADEEEDANGGG